MKAVFTRDEEVLEALSSKVPSKINAALKHLYQSQKLINSIRKQILGLGGDPDDGREALNHALVVFYNQVQEQVYNPRLSSISTYIVKIATQLYYTKRRSDQRRQAMHERSAENPETETSIDPETEFNAEHRKALLDRVLAALGEKCRQLLKLRSFDFSMAEIAEKLNYKTPDVAKMAVLDCRKKLNLYLAERPDLLAELKSL